LIRCNRCSVGIISSRLNSYSPLEPASKFSNCSHATLTLDRCRSFHAHGSPSFRAIGPSCSSPTIPLQPACGTGRA
jgi:hypothetical protein